MAHKPIIIILHDNTPWGMESYTKFTYRCRIREKCFCMMNSNPWLYCFLQSLLVDHVKVFLACRVVLRLLPLFNTMDWKCCIGKHFNICSNKCIGAFAKGIQFLAEHSFFLVTLVTFWKLFSIYFMWQIEICFLWSISTHFWGGSENPPFPHWCLSAIKTISDLATLLM